MTVVSLILLVVGIVVVGWLAHWIITSFLPEPVRMPALAIVGVLLLLVLVYFFFPSIGSQRIW
jgi:hypothetical protein